MFKAPKTIVALATLTITLIGCTEKPKTSFDSTAEIVTPIAIKRTAAQPLIKENTYDSFPGEIIYRFLRTNTSTHLYTTDENEVAYIKKNLPVYSFEGEQFRAVVPNASNEVPVFRLFNTNTGVHHFTIDENEKDYIVKNLKHFQYENIAFHAYNKEQNLSLPVFRFYDIGRAVHFFIADPVEHAYVNKNLKNFTSEGIGFHAHSINHIPVL